MIPAVVTDPASGNPVVVASLERQRVAVEKEIKEACSEFLNEPDWNKNMAIVDQLNRAPYLCPFAIKEIRKQLKTKNPEIEILALQLTETIIKNCPSSHAAVAQEDFMRYLVKVGTNQRQGGKWTQMTTKLKKKKTTINSKHVRSQCIEKALLILKMLAVAYDESHLYPVFKMTYTTLQKQNVRFPETNKDESLNIFSPMHSSGAPDEWGGGGPTAMGSVQNVALEMIRPIIILDGITDQTLVQAQESAQLLFSMINAPVLSYELIPDLTQMLNQSQQQIVVMISEGNAPEKVLMQALQVNDIVNQVLEDAQAIANGTKRRYQEEVNVQKLMLQASDSENPVKDKDDNKDPNNDEPSLEHSISIGDNDDNLLALSGPAKDKLAKKRPSKKSKRQSVDLLNMGGDDKGVVDLMSSENNKPPPKKEESEEDLMGFLGIQADQNNNGNQAPPKPAPTVFDPLEDPTLNNNNNVNNKPPPPAYMDPMGNSYNNMNGNGNNNGNVFRQNNGNNMNNNNGNVFRPNNNGNVMNNNMNNMNNNSNGTHRKLNTIARGNESVLNVLTGEVSPSQSYPNSSNSSIKATPKQEQAQPKQEYNLGGNNNNGNAKTKGNDFDTGNDPFADMDDPFADMGGNAFDDPSPAKPKPKPAQQSKPKPQPKANANDPFADMAGSAFDDPALNMLSNEPQKPKPKPAQQSQPKAIPKPAPHQVQDSNDLILGMFEAGASPDPNLQNKSILKPAQQKKDDNPFGMDDSNPFGASVGDNGGDANPFDGLDNPFGSDDLGDDNPFAMPNNNGNKKQEDFMADRDPFADM